MIVHQKRHVLNRTIWQVELEAGDKDLPNGELWLDGYIHGLSTDLESLWLALALCDYPKDRLTLPVPISAPLLASLQNLVNLSVGGADNLRGMSAARGILSGALVRDFFDIHYALGAEAEYDLLLNVSSGYPSLGVLTTIPASATNAGYLRRGFRRLDRVGELAAGLVLAEVLSVQTLTSYAMYEELDSTNVSLLISTCEICGIKLSLPLADKSVIDSVKLPTSDVLSKRAISRAVWNRYREFPDVAGKISRDIGNTGLSSESQIATALSMTRQIK